MAIVLPLLLLILFGIIDFGLALNRQILLTEAAREGARAAALGRAGDVDAIVTRIIGEQPSVSVTPCPVNPAPGDDATVELGYSYATKTPLGTVMLLFGQGSTGSFELTATGVMPCAG
jgi:TadE-like protein